MMGAAPAESLEACNGLNENDRCVFFFNGMEVEGTCMEIDGESVCVPDMMADMMGGASPAGVMEGVPPDGGVPPQGGGMMGGDLTILPRDPVYRPCNIEFNGKTWWNAGIRFKGNSSLMSAWTSGSYKISFRMDTDEFEDDFPEIDNQRFYGFKELSLANNFSDNSLSREKVTADVFRDAGVPAPKTAFYRVYVDHGDGSKYFGLYTMVEIPRSPMLDAQFGDGSGNLYKPEGTGANWVTFDKESFEKKSNKSEEDWSDVDAAFEALHASRSNASAWRDGLEQVFDAEGFLRWLALNTLIVNWDTYGSMAHNYYIYGDPGANGRICWIPWDNNMAFGVTMGRDTTTNAEDVETDMATGGPAGFMGMGGTTTLDHSEVGDNWPLIRYLLDDPVYYGKYVAFVSEAIDGAFAESILRSRFQTAHDMIAPYVVGTNGEQEGYTMLSFSEAFDNSLDQLFNHIDQRHEAAAEFLSGEEGD